MQYWSENHQVGWHAAEYLIGDPLSVWYNIYNICSLLSLVNKMITFSLCQAQHLPVDQNWHQFPFLMVAKGTNMPRRQLPGCAGEQLLLMLLLSLFLSLSLLLLLSLWLFLLPFLLFLLLSLLVLLLLLIYCCWCSYCCKTYPSILLQLVWPPDGLWLLGVQLRHVRENLPNHWQLWI